MIPRRIPPFVASLHGGTISLNKTAPQSIAKLAEGVARQAARSVADDPDPLALVENIHRDLDDIDSLIAAVVAAVAQLEAAQSALRGETVTATGPAVEVAMSARALADAVELAEPEAETGVNATADALSAAEAALCEQLGTLKARRAATDAMCRRTVTVALALNHISDSDTDRLAKFYDACDGLAFPRTAKTADVRSAAQVFLRSEEMTKKRVKTRKRQEARRELAIDVASVWRKSK